MKNTINWGKFDSLHASAVSYGRTTKKLERYMVLTSFKTGFVGDKCFDSYGTYKSKGYDKEHLLETITHSCKDLRIVRSNGFHYTKDIRVKIIDTWTNTVVFMSR